MKSKKITYILIAAVAAIWGVVFYKFITASNDKNMPESISDIYNRGEVAKDNQIPDTFSLNLDYRDPFWGKEPIPEESAPLTGEQSGTITVAVEKATLSPGAITYGGFIVNPTTKHLVSILTIGGKERMMKEGEVFEDVKLIRNYRDSVKVSYQGSIYYIPK